MELNTYIPQWKSLVKRDILLKRRNIYQLLTALILPVSATFYILHQANLPHISSSARIGVEYDLPLTYLDQDLIGKSNNFHLCVAPRDIDNQFLNSIQESLSLYGQKRFVEISKFENEKHLNERMLKKIEYNGTDCDAGVTIFGNISSSGSYIVRVPDDGCSPVLAQYCSYGILSNIQQAVDNAFLQEWTGNSNFKLPSSKVRGLIDVHESSRSLMYRIIKLMLVAVYFPYVTIIAENALHEKRKIKETMLLMGMKPFSYWLAWLFCEVLLIIIMVLPVTISLIVANVAPIYGILLHFLLWFFLGCTLVVFAMTVTRFCSKPVVVNSIVVFLLLTVVASDVISPNDKFEDIKLTECFAMLASPVAYEKGFNKIIRERDYGEGATCVLIMFTDFFMYSVFDFILEYLFPYGVSVPWGKLKPGGKKKKKPKKRADVQENEAFIGPMPFSNIAEPCIKLEKIKKTYFSCIQPGTTVLDGVTLSILKGEVTCLLGPNGAGKSTLMKVISRVLAPDEGKIITKSSVNFGVCPQENILHDDMNATEHLRFFGSLKGIPDADLDSAVTTLLDNFGLTTKENARTIFLSGGQKRKLCVAIAMIGDPEILLLDEPSSGMSPNSRRQLWNLLREYTNSGHSVLFTTHYMDEAELLSDRIALLNYGKIKYYGTAMDMKKQFGGGYNVRITLQSEQSLYCKSELVSLISDLPSKPQVNLTSDTEIVVKLHSFHAADCIEFFNKLEEQYKDIEPDCFTISISPLEEIFSSLAEENSEQQMLDAHLDESDAPEFSYETSLWASIKELARARCRVFLRSYYTLFPIILPILLLSWNRVMISSRQVTDISPEFYKNDIIKVINRSGKPLKELVKTLSKLDMKMELVKPKVSLDERNFIIAEIRDYEIFNEILKVDWNWTVSLSGPFALPAMQNLMSNILWKTWYDDLGRELKISVEPITIIEQNYSFFQSETFITLVHISACLIFDALAFGLEVVKEREKKVFWLISTTKNNTLAYWISTFIAHLALLSLSFLMIQNVLLIYGVHVFQKFPLWIAFYLSMPGCLLNVYLMAQCFKSYRSADIGMTFAVVIVTTCLFAAFIVGVITQIPSIYMINILVLFLIPIYAPYGLIILLTEGEDGESVTYGSTWSLVCGLVMPVSCFLYAIFIIYLGKRKTFKRREKIQVLNEGAWNSEHNPKSTVVLKSVKKTYRSCSCKRKETVAIKDLNMSFQEGEIFALMGSNGAGKSTLMKLLSLNVELTSGEIYIRDKDIESITYCAEENTVWSNLTVEEHLRLFAALNGVPSEYLIEVTNCIMRDLNMESHAKKRAKHLSGGYQRKLSIAISLLGNANLLLLDEPTTGMDPVSKQHLWRKLHQEFPETSDRTLILTTHSSNEAEVNCSRIGLFMDGSLMCLGTAHELKTEHSKGFELTVKLKNENIEKFSNFLASEIPEAFEKSIRGITVQYYIPIRAFTSMSELFTAVQKVQKFESVEDCFISECSLDQIILDLLSQANTEETGDDECAV